MILRTLFITILITNYIYALEVSERLRLDGYANITGVSSDIENTDSLEINGGIQGRYQVDDNISFTGHIYFEEENASNSLEDYEEDIKWLYVDYYLGNEITFRAGKFQFPIFTSAEIGTIGYSRTWTENPISSYGAFGYDNFTGAEILKNFNYDDFDFLVQLSYGQSENDLPSLNNLDSIKGKADSIGGITLKSSNDWFMLNIGYMRALSSVEAKLNRLPEQELNINFDMYAIETQADVDDFSFKAGYIAANLSETFPDEQRYYTSIEYNYDDFTPYVYYSNEKLDYKEGSQRNLNEVKKYSTGIRYDFSKNIVFKISYIKEKEISKYDNNSENKNSNNILKGAINVLF